MRVFFDSLGDDEKDKRRDIKQKCPGHESHRPFGQVILLIDMLNINLLAVVSDINHHRRFYDFLSALCIHHGILL